MEELLKHWNIGTIRSIEPISSFSGKASLIRTVAGNSFILKEKPDRLKAERESSLLLALSAVGAPVAVPLRARAGDCCASDGGRIFCLYPQLPGQVIPEHYGGNAASRAEMYGKAIACLHTYLLKLEHVEGVPEMHLLEQISEWALPCIKKHGLSADAESLERVWKQVEPELAPLYPELQIQLIHRDAHPGNMLFDGDRLTGFIDFDQVVRGPRIFDLCYCGTSLLLSGFPDEEKRQAWPGLFHALLQGYQVLAPLHPAEMKALYGTMIAIELLFVAFSLEYGEVAAARQNESVVVWLEANRRCLLFEP